MVASPKTLLCGICIFICCSCTFCVTTLSDFSCNWCLGSHLCYETGSNNICDGSAVTNALQLVAGQQRGPSSCPRVEPLDDSIYLIAADTHPENLKFNLYNQQVGHLKCFT